MPSNALQRWLVERTAVLDEVERAHRFVHGSGPGVRDAMQQINQAYAVLLSAQFQAFCRELHTESADWMARPSTNPHHRLMVLENLVGKRKLDHGNPNPGNIGEDFNRFHIAFWTSVDAHHSRNPNRKQALEDLNTWRNAIAHQDFKSSMIRAGRPVLTLAHVKSWRSSCNGLANSFDDVMHSHITLLTGNAPW